MVRGFSRRAIIAAPMLSLLPAQLAFGQTTAWRPSKLVRIICGQASGGTTDVMARLLAAHLQERWGQTIVVENKTGAGGIVGTMEVVRAEADGHTILMGSNGPQSILFSLARSLPYKADDLIPVSNMIAGPNALIVNKALPVKNLREFIDYLKSNPGKVNFGTPGIGTTPHLAGIWFNSLIGAQGTPVHYRGSGPAMTDLLGGVIQYSFDALVNARQPIRAGTVRGLGITGTAPFPGMTELPVLRDSLPELKPFISTSWVGVFLPKGTPAEIVAALNEEVRVFLQNPEMPQRFLDLGGVADYQPADKYAAFIKQETEKWGNVVRNADLKVDL